jgi:hypothetical protein
MILLGCEVVVLVGTTTRFLTTMSRFLEYRDLLDSDRFPNAVSQKAPTISLSRHETHNPYLSYVYRVS